MDTSRAMVVLEPGRMEPREFPLPSIGESDGILKVELVGVCGSDPGIFRGKASRAPRPYPLILGHEIVGRIHAMGEKALQQRGLKIGDRVIVEYAYGCGECAPCIAGRYTICKKMYTYGSMVSCQEPPHLYGAYSQYLYIHPRAMIHKIGEDISPEEGVLIGAVLGNGVRWLSRVGQVAVGKSVVVIGPGQQGLSAVIVAKESGATPIIIIGLEKDRARLEMAKRLGADVVIVADREDPEKIVSEATHGLMADTLIDVSANPAGAAMAVALAGLGATVVLPGLYGMNTPVPLFLDKVVFKELRLLGAYSQDFEAVEAAIKIGRSKRYPLKELISHRFPLERAEEAVRLVGGEYPERNPLKVVIDPWA